MKLKEIVSAYRILGEANVNNLEESEILKIVKARKAMRQFAEEYESFLKDCQDKFKPENFEEIQNKAQKWNELTQEEKASINNVLMSYQKAINDAVYDELEKDVTITVEKLEESSIIKLLKNNEWSINKLDELQIML